VRTALVIAMAAWLALAPACAAMAADRLEPPAADDPSETDDAEDAFLGGPDPPCLLPCVVVLWALVLALGVAALVVGLAVSAAVLAVCAALLVAGVLGAAYLALQGAGYVAGLALVPATVVIVWAVVRARRPGKAAARQR